MNVDLLKFYAAVLAAVERFSVEKTRPVRIEVSETQYQTVITITHNPE